MAQWIWRLARLIQPEFFAVLALGLLFEFLFHKIVLKGLSEKRNRSQIARFKSAFFFFLVSASSALVFFQFFIREPIGHLERRVLAGSGLIALFVGALFLIRLAQIGVYLYLFFRNMRKGVPRLIANLFTFLFSTFVFSGILSFVFEFHVSTLLTTSAIFSVVLGLAMQDTLGNLFSGLTLQLDQPFQIGDWVELQSDSQKILGQIHEMTWRATFIMTFSDELIMIPNKVMAGSKVTLYSHGLRPVRLGHAFRFRETVDFDRVRKILFTETLQTPGVMQDPPPRVLVIESAESWVLWKVFYSIHDFSMRYRVADQVQTAILNTLKSEEIPVAQPQIRILKPDESDSVTERSLRY